jgi:hypothetical protein
MSWFQVSGGSLRYRGRLTRAPFAAWIGTPDGQSAMEAEGRERRYRFLARSRAARAVWRELSRVAREDPLRSAIQDEAAHYTRLVTEIAHAPSLPRAVVALRRVVVVPRAMIIGRAHSGVLRRVGASFELGTLTHPVRLFFSEQVIQEIDAAMLRRKPTIKAPIAAHEEWMCIGIDDTFEWVDPMLSGPGRLGHVIMFEMPRAGLTRRDRKHLEATVSELVGGLVNWSRVQRHGTVGMAAAGLRAG